MKLCLHFLGTQAGIYRLAILPWRENGELIPEDNWQIAVAEGRFVTIVIDDQAPGGHAVLHFSGYSVAENNIFRYSSSDRFLVIDSNFSHIHDNFNGGGRLP